MESRFHSLHAGTRNFSLLQACTLSQEPTSLQPLIQYVFGGGGSVFLQGSDRGVKLTTCHLVVLWLRISAAIQCIHPCSMGITLIFIGCK